MEGTVKNDLRNEVNCNVWMDSASDSNKLKNICETVWEIWILAHIKKLIFFRCTKIFMIKSACLLVIRTEV